MQERCTRLASGMQCNPAVAGLAVVIVLALAGEAEIRAHETGLAQAARGAAAGAAVLVVLGGLACLARWVSAQDAPQPEYVMPVVTLIDEPDVRMMPAVSAGDRADMEAEADRLADGTLDFVVTARGSLFELDEQDEEVT